MRRKSRPSHWIAAVVGALALTGSVSLVALSTSTGAPLHRVPSIEAGFHERTGGQPRDHAPKSAEEIRRIVDRAASEERFDGTVVGWRIAPNDVLDALGIRDRNLQRSCDPVPAGAETRTALDFTLTYMPPGIAVGDAVGPVKWICAGEGLSVAIESGLATPYGAGSLWVERSIRGRQTVALAVARDSVQAGTINGLPAIFVHPADDASGLGVGRIIVIEDNAAPEFTILRITAENGVPFSELIKIAEGVR
jgi:hypothetical protein